MMNAVINSSINDTSNTEYEGVDLHPDRDESDMASAYLSDTIELDPEDAQAYFCRGMAYAHRFEDDKRTQTFNESFDELGTDDAIATDNQRTANLLDGYCDQVIEDLTKAIELGIVCSAAYEILGKMYWHKGNYDKAVAGYNKAVELDPENTEAYEGRALTHFESHHLEAAWDDVKTCQKLNHQVDPEFLIALQIASAEAEIGL
jgi:tetratricopeptide (TPR) repeat protein